MDAKQVILTLVEANNRHRKQITMLFVSLMLLNIGFIYTIVDTKKTIKIQNKVINELIEIQYRNSKQTLQLVKRIEKQ